MRLTLTLTLTPNPHPGKDAVIDVCRKAAYGYDQRAEVLGLTLTKEPYP